MARAAADLPVSPPCKGRARQGGERGTPRHRGAWRRHAVALGDVRARPRRAHRRAHQHDRAGHLRAGQSRVRFRQGGVPRTHGARRGFRSTARTCAMPTARRSPDYKDRALLDYQRRARRVDRACLRAVAAHVLARGPALCLHHRHHQGAGRGAARPRAPTSSARCCIAIAAMRSSCSTSAPPSFCSPATRTTCSSTSTTNAPSSSPATTRIT